MSKPGGILLTGPGLSCYWTGPFRAIKNTCVGVRVGLPGLSGENEGVFAMSISRRRVSVVSVQLFAVAFLLVVSAKVSWAAGSQAAPPIDISNAKVESTNGDPTCIVDDILSFQDMVTLVASGAVDTDGDCAANDINLDETRWHMTSGHLTKLKGRTTQWRATSLDPEAVVATVSAFFNDKHESGDYNDDQSAAKTIACTGFKVGCRLNVDTTGASYTKYHDGSTAGNTTGLSGSDYSLTKETTDADGESARTIIAEWTSVVWPAGTKIKGNVKINGNATSTGSSLQVATADNDPNHTSSATMTCATAFNGNFSYSFKTGAGDLEIAWAGAGIALQGDWLDTVSYNRAVASTDNKSHSSLTLSSGTKYHVCNKVGDSKKANYKIGYKTEMQVSKTTYATVNLDSWAFSIPQTPVYVVP